MSMNKVESLFVKDLEYEATELEIGDNMDITGDKPLFINAKRIFGDVVTEEIAFGLTVQQAEDMASKILEVLGNK